MDDFMLLCDTGREGEWSVVNLIRGHCPSLLITKHTQVQGYAYFQLSNSVYLMWLEVYIFFIKSSFYDRNIVPSLVLWCR